MALLDIRSGGIEGYCSGRMPSSVFRPFGIQPPWGILSLMATSRAAWSAPVWPPDMIFASIMDKITLC